MQKCPKEGTTKLLSLRRAKTVDEDVIKKYEFLPQEGGDRKYVEKMVPGYTGIVDFYRFEKFKLCYEKLEYFFG